MSLVYICEHCSWQFGKETFYSRFFLTSFPFFFLPLSWIDTAVTACLPTLSPLLLVSLQLALHYFFFLVLFHLSGASIIWAYNRRIWDCPNFLS